MSDKEALERLKKFRKALTLSQESFAKPMGLSQSRYASYESGQNKLPYSLLESMVFSYGLNVNWLITGDGSMQQDMPDLQGYTQVIDAVSTIKEEGPLPGTMDAYRLQLGNCQAENKRLIKSLEQTQLLVDMLQQKNAE